MTPELTALALAGLLQVVQYVLMAVPANLELGTAKTASPRDRDRLGGDLMDQVSPRTARLYRAMNNHFEGLILFTLAVVVVTMSAQSTPLTAACGWTGWPPGPRMCWPSRLTTCSCRHGCAA